ncbi:hypothetical protein TPHA_0A02460 [Tetrapisispora phaffii CBS 4417]|uniref:CCZ1/INTU/HSP4 first Longin domain-containing protein n=1 Tax=Tetrapisispora phaffii (strain ATCC 24235 / CBS 4417 / NBRC 1672 / NRRL Y-8282 / UCD 70-5) TaxID=1071381 RepID=G8BN51_TETPH|nr:hypothetical protein TPHA_0A02460 [Tetrapisispora phaffii CBS 4417]CCE61329.1 hypothetical protein TPHA_0A02460 [Tetrapisispora phaffii CBS 4417]
MLNYLAIYDPLRSTNEDDTFKQLILYHSFNEIEHSLNEKLANIGILQGIWNLTDTLIGDDKGKGKIIELSENEVLMVITFEKHYFFALDITTAENIPQQYWLTNMWLCYRFFILQYNYFKNYEAGNNLTKLTNDLNEYVIPFWQDLVSNPTSMFKKNWYTVYNDCYKISELEFKNTNKSWESQINQSILLQDENYLGIKDILVYHLPSLQYNNAYNTKNFGFVKNFTNELENLSDLSNWIYHLHSTYGVLSSHVLSGNVHYISKSNIELLGNDADFTANSSEHIDGNNDSQINESTENNSNSNTFNEQTKNIIHNITLPVSFAYDTFQEVGVTTGISKSMSLMLDYVPKFSFSRNSKNQGNDVTNGNGNGTLVVNKDKNISHGFLISPWANKYLPYDYKVKRLNLKYNDIQLSKNQTESYNCLFWYFQDVLVIIACDPNFKSIWNHEYLSDLNYKLYESMVTLYETATEPSFSSNSNESFAYTVIDKKKRTIHSSIPAWISNGSEAATENMFSQLIINGVDQLFGTNSFENISQITDIGGITSMGNWFCRDNKALVDNGNGNKTNFKKQENLIAVHKNFLFAMPNFKLLELHNELLQFNENIEKSQCRDDIRQRQLMKLSNGLLCYIENSGDKLEFLIRNWYDDSNVSPKLKNMQQNHMLNDFGKDVLKWKDSQVE